MTKGVLFQVGQIVHHVRYGYRGVIVDCDPRCMAADEWYAHQTKGKDYKPTKEQPWYHVLVHESGSVTYPAESSLELDESGEEIVHPLLNQFFNGFEEGRYTRNEVPWPETNS